MSDKKPSVLSRPEVTKDVSRGTIRYFENLTHACLSEFSLKSGRRVDVMCLTSKGKFIAIEVKSSAEDFNVDTKWPEYLPFCDEFYFAVSADFPTEILPADVGLILADRYGAEIMRQAHEGDLNPARRKALTLQFARQAATGLQKLIQQL